MVADRRADREAQVERAGATLDAELEKADIPAEIIGRAKHFYSIYDKMAKKGKEFNEIYDLTAMRVIVERGGEEGTRDCYGALGLIHSLWKPMPGRFKDFIAMPKLNRYRSLHTTVIGPSGTPLEIQVRTREMHEEAEYGVAAHWLYKRGRRGKAGRRLGHLGEDADGLAVGGDRPVRVHAHAAHRPVRRRGLRVHAEGRGEDASRRRDADRLRVRGAHRRRAPHRRRQGERPHRAAPLQAQERRLRRDPHLEVGPRARHATGSSSPPPRGRETRSASGTSARRAARPRPRAARRSTRH